VGRDEALGLIPTLEPARLRGGVLYRDGQFDDARLAVALARTADDLGATVLNALEVTALGKNPSGMVDRLTARDTETGETFAVAARSVINATGVFADELRRMDDPAQPGILSPSQGAHVVLDRSFLPGETALMVPRTDDGRVLFAIPWRGRVLVGTTDTPVQEVSREPRPLPEELAFLLRHAGRYMVKDPRIEDVRCTFAGLRPLFRPGGRATSGTAKVSREHATLVSQSGLVTITGGKWTTYRRMGRDAVDLAAKVGGLSRSPSATTDLHLHGWVEKSGGTEFAWLGADEPAFLRMLEESPGFRKPLHPDLPSLSGEVVWACRHESARTVEDALARRTRALLQDARASSEAAPRVAELMAIELKHDPSWIASQVEAFQTLARGYLPER
ncbi:MAG: glycerol-3-phosphate dehydrogenase/oxidase, partial [Isosphaeraceae bacterium]